MTPAQGSNPGSLDPESKALSIRSPRYSEESRYRESKLTIE